MQVICRYFLILIIFVCCVQNRNTWASQETILTGIVSKVRDGDTLEIGNVPIRLNGISAPELNERFGKESKAFIVKLVLGKGILCKITGKKSYDRFVGTCYLGHQDIGAAVIKAGLALDCLKYSGGQYKKFETKIGRARIKLPAYCH